MRALLGLLTIATFAGDSRLADLLMQGDSAAARHLLTGQKLDVNVAQGDGMTPLHWAAHHDDLETARLLLAAGANVNAETRLGGITPLFMACTNGNPHIIALLLKSGASAKAVKSNGTTALMIAAASGSTDSVKTLLDAGADINATEKAHGQTALMFAAALNRADVATYLLASHADASIATVIKKLERVRFDSPSLKRTTSTSPSGAP